MSEAEKLKKAEQNKKMAEEKKKALEKIRTINFQKGDYQVKVHILEGRGLKGGNNAFGSGMPDPMAQVEILDGTKVVQSNSTRLFQDTEECVRRLLRPRVACTSPPRGFSSCCAASHPPNTPPRSPARSTRPALHTLPCSLSSIAPGLAWTARQVWDDIFYFDIKVCLQSCKARPPPPRRPARPQTAPSHLRARTPRRTCAPSARDAEG